MIRVFGQGTASKRVIDAVADEVKKLDPVSAALRLVATNNQMHKAVVGFILAGACIFLTLASLLSSGVIQDKTTCETRFGPGDANFKSGYGHELECKTVVINPDYHKNARIAVCSPIYAALFCYALSLIFILPKTWDNAVVHIKKLLNSRRTSSSDEEVSEHLTDPKNNSVFVYWIHGVFLLIGLLFPTLRWDGIVDWHWWQAWLVLIFMCGFSAVVCLYSALRGELAFLQEKKEESTTQASAGSKVRCTPFGVPPLVSKRLPSGVRGHC